MRINQVIAELQNLQDDGETDVCISWYDRETAESIVDQDILKEHWTKTCAEFDDTERSEAQQTMLDCLNDTKS
jgi:hypothetical protein